LTLLFPNLFGEPNNGYWGVPFYEELTAYMGVLPLAAVFIVRRRPATILLTAFVIIGVVVSLGIEGGLFSILYGLLPGYSLFRVPSRALYFVVVGGAGLVALFISDLQAMSRDERASLLRRALWILPIGVVICLVLSFGLMANFNAGSAGENPPWRVYHTANVAALTALAIGGLWLALRLWLGSWIDKRWVLVVTMAVALVDVWRIAAPLVTVSAIDVPPIWQAMASVIPAGPDFRVMTVPKEITWQAGTAYTHHLNASGYDPLVSDAFQRLLDASEYNPTSLIARLLSVRYAISNKPYDQSGLPGSETVAEIRPQQGDWHIYEVVDPLPRVFVAQTVLTIADNAIARQWLESGASRDLAILDRKVDCGTPAEEPIPLIGNEVEPVAHIVAYTPNVVDVTTSSDKSSVLVLTDSYDPNWAVRVDDVPADLLRVDTALRGVCVPVGEHHIRFDYQPRAFYTGVILSAAGWLTVGIIGLMMFVRARRRRLDEDVRG
jgi:hypothetical protein